jgi:hypothetical protein
MTEVVHPSAAHVVALRPRPPWCTLRRHFADGEVIDVGDGYHGCRPEIAGADLIPECTAAVVRTILKSWTHPLDAEPGAALIETNIGTARELIDTRAEITPGQAGALAAALLELADPAEHAGTG